MYNYVMLVGRIVNDFELKEIGENKKVISLVLAVNRPFKNSSGTYDTDFIKVSLWDMYAELANEHLRKGNLVGIKGRLQTTKETLQSGAMISLIEVIGDNVIFLSPKNA